MRIQITEGAKQGYLDVLGDSQAILNISNNDIKDITKMSGSYTNTLKIANTKEAQLILGHIFSVSVSVGSGVAFDTRKKVKCALVEDGYIFQEELNLKLKDVTIDSNRIVSYSVELYDDKAELFNSMSNRMLTDLDFSDGDHTLTRELIVDSFNNTSDDSLYMYHLTTTNSNEYSIAQFKPAIFGMHYLKRIGETNGIDIEVEDGELIRFKDYVLPCTRQNISVGAEPIVIQRRETDTDTYTALNTFSLGNQVFASASKRIIFDIEDFDPEAMYNDATGAFEPMVNFPAGQGLNFKVEFEAELSIQNNTSNTLTQENIVPGMDRDDLMCIRGYLTKNGNTVALSYDDSGVFASIPRTETLLGNETKVIGTGEGSFILPVGNIMTTDDVFQSFAAVYSPSGRWNKWVSTPGGSEVPITLRVKIKRAKITIVANVSGGFYLGNRVRLNDFIPDKVKQSDFVKAVTVLNNMWVIKIDDKKFKLKRRRDYLAAGKVVDWSNKFKHKEYSITEVSEITNKQMLWSYKQDKDVFNQAYTDATGEVYGQFTFTFDNEHVRGVKKMDIAFASTPMHETSFGAIVPAINGAEPKHEPRILINGGVFECNPFLIKVQGGEDMVVTNYPHVSHFDHPTEPNIDLNFGVCQYYFYPVSRIVPNNMFNMNWRGVCHQINTGRLLKGKINMSALEVRDFDLSDRVFCMGQYWQVNDLKVNMNRRPGDQNYLALVEMIPAEELEEITQIGPVGGAKPPIVKPPKKPNINPIDSIANGLSNMQVLDVAKSKNIYLNSGGAILQVLGVNNTILPGVKNALIVGDDQTIDEDGIYFNGINIVKSISVQEVTISELQQLIFDKSLIIGARYWITDREVLTIAVTEGEVSNISLRKMSILKEGCYETSTNGILTEDAMINVGDIWLWGARAWEATTSGTMSNMPFSQTDINTNGSGIVFSQIAVTEEAYYEDKVFLVSFDVINDVFIWQEDDRGNRLYTNRVSIGGLWLQDGLVYADWGDKKIYGNILERSDSASSNVKLVNNKCNVISNNKVVGSIYRNESDSIELNRCRGSIRNNKTSGTIASNTNYGMISGNECGSITLNSNKNSILSNTISGSITENSNAGFISSNSNNGNIVFNKNAGRIDGNSNNGDIQNNSCGGVISGNSNTSFISNNTNSGRIENNSNRGNISNNRNNGSIVNCNVTVATGTNHIRLNANNGDIVVTFGATNIHVQYNVNNGSITGTKTATVSDPQVNK